METLLKDLRYAYRTLLKSPGFTSIAVLSLALGIGANTAIFSFIDTVLLSSLPVQNPQSLVLFGEGKGRGIYGGTPEGVMELFSWQQYRHFRDKNQVFEDIAASDSRTRQVYFTNGAAPEGAQATLVSNNFFRFFNLKPAAGQFFTPGTAGPQIVLSHSFWTAHFNADPSAVGQTLTIGNRVFSIVGVAPSTFFGPRLGEVPDFWLPLSNAESMPGASGHILSEPLTQFMTLIGRLKPGVTRAQAEANINLVYSQLLPTELPGSASAEEKEMIRHAHIVMVDGSKGVQRFSSEYAVPLRILMIVVALVLVIACANVANLLLAQSAKRQKEFALRVAIGAGRMQLIRQVLTESLMMSAAAGLLGILIASAGGKLLVHLISTGPRALAVSFNLDTRVLAFTILLSIATGVLFGIVPAIRAGRTEVSSSLKETKAARLTFGRLLIAGQIALSLGLLVTAGLLLHSFTNLVHVNTGFDRENVLLFKLDTESAGYADPAPLIALYRRLEEKVAAVPGVGGQSVSLFAFNEGQRQDGFEVRGANLPRSSRITGVNFVSPGFFRVMHVPILLGRGLSSNDEKGVIVVSESFAKKAFGGVSNALGRNFDFEGADKPVRIIGIVGDVKTNGVRDKSLMMTYVSAYHVPEYLHNLAVRVSGDPSTVAAEVRAAIQSTEKNLPIRWTTTLADAVSDSLVRERAIAQLSAFFAALALFLSAIGLYGTISFAVSRRTNEIGIRMALGAERVGVLGMVLKDAMLLAGIGMAIGLPLSLLITREMESMLYGLGRVDPWSVLGAVAALTIVAAIAGYLPARRAASVDPMEALRYE